MDLKSLPLHDDLISILEHLEANSLLKFGIADTTRSKEEHQELLESGASTVIDSKHLDGRAVDIYPIVAQERRSDVSLYTTLANNFKESAETLGIVISWGGDWDDKDYQHFELN